MLAFCLLVWLIVWLIVWAHCLAHCLVSVYGLSTQRLRYVWHKVQDSNGLSSVGHSRASPSLFQRRLWPQRWRRAHVPHHAPGQQNCHQHNLGTQLVQGQWWTSCFICGLLCLLCLLCLLSLVTRCLFTCQLISIHESCLFCLPRQPLTMTTPGQRNEFRRVFRQLHAHSAETLRQAGRRNPRRSGGVLRRWHQRRALDAFSNQRHGGRRGPLGGVHGAIAAHDVFRSALGPGAVGMTIFSLPLSLLVESLEQRLMRCLFSVSHYQGLVD